MSPTPQTPPTDQPLTAGDVPLLREGDVLRVTRADSYLREEGFADGSLVHFRSWDGRFIDIADLPYRQGTNPDRFTFVSRPATLAASEGEGVNASTLAAAVSSLERSLYRHVHGEKWGCDYIAVRTVLAALASPPVSERERELEGALRALSKYLCHDDDCQLVLQAGPIPPRRCTCGLERARALTAQPAGEGK